ncbi:hypothetical protein LR48_Vigan03g032000 [Vigna angularis]|uniref:Peptidase S8/S53 domain-containing protein n=1 Tax=Phaseolus angularis TaxID=3914 RepID=A0A0L9U3J2_PHAAN|nr:hypothetical protein LR48_Vigan03g032000 [Vigna angularis]
MVSLGRIYKCRKMRNGFCTCGSEVFVAKSVREVKLRASGVGRRPRRDDSCPAPPERPWMRGSSRPSAPGRISMLLSLFLIVFGVPDVRFGRSLGRFGGARFFDKVFEAYNGQLVAQLQTARDFVGHGTHTLSTAGGNFVPGASVFAVADCYGADMLAAIDQAIDDGVDLIDLSIGGFHDVSPEGILTDEVSMGAFHAIFRNILLLVASAGNDGPIPGSVVNVAPWVFTIDRDFSSTLTINNNQQIEIISVAEGQEAVSACAKGMVVRNQPQQGTTLAW